MATWPAVQRYQDAQGREAVEEIAADLEHAWGDRRVHLRWPLHLLVGRIPT